MRRNLTAYIQCQVFLNYPFDDNFLPIANAMNFAIVASGLLPVCAYDLTTPDQQRLDMLVHAISNCRYSAHDFSRYTGEGASNFARMNMPIEMGMAIFYTITSQKHSHNYAFFVPNEHNYKQFVSDLSGLDPICHDNNELTALVKMYEWLRQVVTPNLFNLIAISDLEKKFEEFKLQLSNMHSSDKSGVPSHQETRELMYQICGACGWWDWRSTKYGREEFPIVPLSWKVKSTT